MIISASKPKKKVCKAVAQSIIKVMSGNLEVKPMKKIIMSETANSNKKRLIGVNTFIGLKNNDSLVINFKKLKKSAGFIEDLPCLL